jgi:hypothetical protein
MFKNSIDLFNGVLTELNKEFNASFEVWDYEYFLNKAIYEWIKLKYTEYETTQKRTDDLQLITQRNVNVKIQNDNIVILPQDYLFLLGVRGNIQGRTKCEDGGIIKEIYKMTSDLKGYTNYYHQLKNWYEVSQDKLYLTPERGSTIKDIYIEYISKPEVQSIDIDNVGSPKNNLIYLLSKEYICLEIIKIITTLFLESIEQPRTQGHLQLNNQYLTN